MKSLIRYDQVLCRDAVKLILVLFVISLFAGCSLHRERTASLTVIHPDAFSDGSLEQGGPVGKWWQRFGEETLNKLMDEAFENNLDIAESYERLRQARAIERLTESSGGPSLNITGSGGRTRQAGAMGPVTSDTYSLSAAASYEIDLWGRRSYSSDAALFRALASEEDFKAMFITVSAQVADLYYLAAEQRAQLDFTDRTILSLQENLNSVERRYRGGLVPGIDLLQSRQSLASAKAQRPLFEATLSETLHALSVLVGRFPEKSIGGDITELDDRELAEAGLPSQLLMRRPDIKAALLRLRARDKEVGAAVADRFPSFTLSGAYGGMSDTLNTMLDSPNIFWNALLTVVQPVIDSGRRKSEVRRTEAVMNEELARYHKTVLNAFNEVEDALSHIEATKKRIGLLKDTVMVSEQSLRITLERYNQGLTDYIPVLGAQQGYIDAKSALISSQRLLISNRIQLVRALGGDWVNEYTDRYGTVNLKGVEIK